jgi:hypothetical protein
MHRRLLKCLVVIALTLAAAPATSAASPEASIVATGVLQNSAGHGSAGRVYALAWPGEDFLRTLGTDAKIQTPQVGSAETDARGRFAVAVDDAAVPSTHRRRDGGVNLLLIGTDGSNQAMAFVATAPRSQAQAGAAQPAGSAQSTPPSVVLKMTFALPRTSTSGTNSGVTPNAAPPPATYPCVGGWSRMSTHLVWVSMGQSYSGPAKNFAVLEQSSSTTNGAAISATGDYGSWSASGSQTLTVSNTKTWDEVLTDRDFQSEFQYSKWRVRCQGFDRWAFTPDFGTGGDRSPAAVNYPAKNHCTSISAGLWSRSSSSGSAYSESLGVKSSAVLGIGLNVTHNYSATTGQKFTLNYRNSSTVTICGDTNFPSLARKPRI